MILLLSIYLNSLDHLQIIFINTMFNKIFGKKTAPSDNVTTNNSALQDQESITQKDPNPVTPQTNTALPQSGLANLPPPKLAGTVGNVGMQTGMVASVAGAGGSFVDDLLIGQVGGTMIGQRIDQAKSHAYWKERQQEFINGNEDAVKNPAGKSAREVTREERRKNRWSRRAERREG